MIKRLSFFLVTFLFLQVAQSQVNAGFVANQTSGCPNPFLLILNDVSTAVPGPIDTWNWQLTGPAGFTTQTSATNGLPTTLTIPGFYTVSLTVCSGGVCDTETQTNFVQVFEPPVIGMTITPLTGCPPHQVCFDGTFDPGCDTIVSSVIDVKDGTVYSNVEDVCHTYPNSGTFTNFTVSVLNGCGCVTTETYTDIVSVSPAPNASFSSSNAFSCTAPLLVNFNSTSLNTVPGSIYEWNIPPLVNGALTQNVSQSFPAGTYDVELIVTNPNGCADTVSQAAYVVVGDPQANFGININSGCPGTSVSFTDSSSGSPVSWSWVFEGHGTSASQNPTINFSSPGNWGVSLVVQYAGGCSDSIYQANLISIFQLPINNFTVTDSSSCTFPFTTTFSSTSTNAATTNWTFPGGTPGTFTGVGPVNVTYNVLGSYSVQMNSTSAQGCVSNSNFTNVIDVLALTATIIVDSTGGCVPITSNLSFTLSSGEIAASQNWTLPGSDIGISALPNPTAVYNAIGCNDVTLSVTTVSGCTTTITDNNVICGGTPPTGGFSLSPYTFCFEADIVGAAYTGTGADSIFWDFGDTSPPQWAADDVPVTHNYPDDIGTYTVTMIPYRFGCPGDTTIYVDTVQILGPIAVFDADFESCDNWNTFNFTDQSVEADSVFYQFGDPTTTLDTSSMLNPSWTYPALNTVATYSVTLIAYNFTTGCEHQATNSITMYPAFAGFTYSDSIGCSPFTVQFLNNSLESSTNPSFTVWNWVNTLQFSGSGSGVIWDNGFTRSHTFTTPGIYSVSMIYRNRQSCWDTITQTDIITVHGTSAGFSQDSTSGCAPLTVNFTDTSVAPITYIESWHWDFGVPGILTDTSNLQNPNYVYSIPGLYTTTLTVIDSFGCTDIVTSAVNVAGSIASFSLSDTFFCANQNIGLIDASIGTNLDYNWTFVNGTPASSSVMNPLSLSYATEGFQNILLEVTDQNGCFDDTSITVPVFDVVAQATASIDSIVCFANTTAVSFNNTSFNNIDPSSVFWDLGNGTTSTLFNPSAVYNLAGNYVVSMSIASNSGCRDTTIIDTIFVGGPYAEIVILDRDTACVCETISFELLTVNAANPTFISGDGGFVSYLPNGLIGDTIRDTLSYQYCQTGSFVPQVFIDDGFCSGNVELNDTIRIDSLVTDFGIGPIAACDSGIVCFFDSSYNVVQGSVGFAQYNWDFGDGGTDTLADPCHNYSAPGFYNIQLAVLSNFNCRDTVEYQIDIPASPIVLFAQSDSIGCIGLDLQFWDSTRVDSSTSIQSWDWDFGNGVVSALQNPSTVYNVGGLFTATLIVVDSNGCVDEDSVTIEVFSLPNISASADTVLCFGDSAQLTASGGATYSWQPNYNITDSSVFNPIVFPANDTIYVIEGRNVNGCPNWDTVFVDVNFIDAFFSAPSVCLNETTPFTDLSTSDGIITSWTWNFDEPLSGVNDTSLLQNPTHDYASQGAFDVNLSIVDDNQCSADSTITLVVQDSPIASFTADSVCFGQTHTFNSDSSFSGGANIIRYHWDFGVSGTLTDTSNTANTVFTYNNPGLYTVCLSITTDQACAGNTDDTCFVVQVYDFPNSNFTVDSACFGNQNSYTDLSQSGVDAGIATSVWDFGQNVADTLLGFSSPFDTQFLYDTTGQYTVTLTIIDSNLCQSSSSDLAFVFPNPEADFSFTSLCQSQNNDFVSLPAFGSSMDLTYYWDFDEGAGYSLGDSVQVFAFAVTGNHQISHVIVDALGCTDTIQQVINVLTAPSAVITGDNSVCRGISTSLTGASSVVSAPPAVYSWSVTTSQTSTITYSPNADTRVFLTVTDGNGCFDTTSTFINVLEVPEADFDWSDACEDLQFTLNSLAEEGDALITNYTWNINSPISGSTSFSTPNVNYLVPSEDTLSVTFIVEDANACIDSITQTVIVDQQVVVTVVTSDYLLCPGDSLLLDLGDSTQFIVSGVESTIWTPTTGVIDINGDSITLSPSTSTTYNLTAFSTLGQCPPDDDNVINVEVGPDPLITIDAVPNPVLVSAISNITSGVVPYNVNTDSMIWDNSTGTLNTDFGFNIEAMPIEETTYPVQLIYYFDSIRCVKDTAITIAVITECSGEIIYVPNIFTPNDDGRNDEFKVTGYGIEVINYLRIFDRWGQLMFEAQNIEVNNGRMDSGTGWLGTNQGGAKCNSGVFIYTYELICASNDVVRGSGNVTLIK